MLKLLLGYIVVVYVDVGGQECGVGVAMAGNVGVAVAANDMFFSSNYLDAKTMPLSKNSNVTLEQAKAHSQYQAHSPLSG